MAEREATLERNLTPDKSFWVSTIPLPLDDVNNPTVGGKFEPGLNLTDAKVIARPEDRKSTPEKVLDAKEDTVIDSQKYMQTVVRRRWEFYNDLGKLDQLNVVRNYDIPLVRVMWEQMKTDEQKRQFMEHETNEALAALGERHNLVEMTPRYIIDKNRKLRYAPFPIEPFEEADRRAVEHYKNLQSPDVIREQAGLKGRLKIQEKMADPTTPIGFTMAMISGPGLAPGSKQIHNFVWSFVLKQHSLTGQRLVEMTPLTSQAEYDQYKTKVLKIKPDYFQNQTQALDLHFLENPLEFEDKSIPEIFTLLTGETKDHRPNEKFQQFKEENKPRIRYFLESICAAIFDPQEAAKRWQAVLAGGDIIWRGLNKIGEKAIRTVSNVVKFIPTFRDMAEEVNYLARQKIEAILGPCGWSGDFSLGGIIGGISGVISGAISAISGLFKDKDYCINCGACGALIKQVVRHGQKCPVCPAIRKC